MVQMRFDRQEKGKSYKQISSLKIEIWGTVCEREVPRVSPVSW